MRSPNFYFTVHYQFFFEKTQYFMQHFLPINFYVNFMIHRYKFNCWILVKRRRRFSRKLIVPNPCNRAICIPYRWQQAWDYPIVVWGLIQHCPPQTTRISRWRLQYWPSCYCVATCARQRIKLIFYLMLHCVARKTKILCCPIVFTHTAYSGYLKFSNNIGLFFYLIN